MKNPLITMTAIAGRPCREEIYDYMSSLKENGIEQAMLYPRSGCEIEYLSEEWFETIGNFIESARALDMCIWLYDDFNWPSGDAGGRVTAIPKFRLKAISTRGESIGQISHKSLHNSGLFGEKYFPDLLCADAVKYFIKCTHEEYFKRFGKDFGTIIKGIFTDEPSIGYCCQDDYIPYYDGLESDYFELCGRDFNDDMRSCYEDFYLNAISAISKRFCSCYIDTLSSWCYEHGILMTGHLMCDNEPFWTTKHNGRLLKNLSHFSLPGIDDIETRFDDRSEMALLGAIQYAKGENGAMAELFALGPCDMPYSKKRVMLYLMACHGVDHYFLAISHIDMRGNMLVKDFFSNFSADQPDFEGMRALADDAKRASLLAKKDFCADVYIRYPFSISAKNITKNLDLSSLFDLINELTYQQIQWKFIDDEMPTDAPIIELSDTLEPLIDGKAVDIASLGIKPIVTDLQGNAPRGIFVRRVADGELVVLNLFAPKGNYLINGKSIFLDRYDIYSSRCVRNLGITIEKSPEFSVSYKNDNVARAMYIDMQNTTELYCEQDTDAVLAVRTDTEAFLNGSRLCCSDNLDTLPRGMRKLYSSLTVRLKRGANIVKSSKDFKYMPSVLILGDFSYRIEACEPYKIFLSKRATSYRCGEKIYDYGRVEFSCEVCVPSGACSLEICGTSLFTKVYADKTLLGERIASPYEYSIDSALWGKKIRLKIVQYSSLAPMFGDVAHWDKSVKECGWRGTPSTNQEPFGLEKIKWIIK